MKLRGKDAYEKLMKDWLPGPGCDAIRAYVAELEEECRMLEGLVGFQTKIAENLREELIATGTERNTLLTRLDIAPKVWLAFDAKTGELLDATDDDSHAAMMRDDPELHPVLQVHAVPVGEGVVDRFLREKREEAAREQEDYKPVTCSADLEIYIEAGGVRAPVARCLLDTCTFKGPMSLPPGPGELVIAIDGREIRKSVTFDTDGLEVRLSFPGQGPVKGAPWEEEKLSERYTPPVADRAVGQRRALVVNAECHFWCKEQITFEDVVALSDPSAPLDVYTVTYYRGHATRPQGELSPGDTVRAVPGMVFNVSRTDRA